MYFISPEQVSASTIVTLLLFLLIGYVINLCHQFRPFFSRELYGVAM